MCYAVGLDITHIGRLKMKSGTKGSAVLLTMLALGASFASAQQPAGKCPTINVAGVSKVQEGTAVTFDLKVSGGDPNVTPTYFWSLSTGRIVDGQGTSSIVLDSEGMRGKSVTATADLGGFARECPHTASLTTTISAPLPAVKFAEYIAVDLAPNKERLNEFVRKLQLDPTTQGYLIAYGGRRSGIFDAQQAAANAIRYTSATLKMDSTRTLTGDGGFREKPTVELWIATAGGEAPKATPTVEWKDVKPE